jgi:hypothetical protein
MDLNCFKCAPLVAAVIICGCAVVKEPSGPMPWPSEVQDAATGAQLETLRGIISQSVERYKSVRDYRCVFQKRQRIKECLQAPQRSVLKFRKPMSVYMKWISKPHEGQEILYSPPCYGGKALAHPGGWKGSIMPAVPIDADGYWVMRDNIHPINHLGLGHFLDVFEDNSRRAIEEGASTLIDRGKEMVGARRTRVVEAVLPPEREKGYYCYRCIVWFDEELLLPVKIQVYDWDDNLSEEYVYEDLEINVGLDDDDFDRENEEYNF